MENIDTTLVNFLAYSINLSDIYILFFYDGSPPYRLRFFESQFRHQTFDYPI